MKYLFVKKNNDQIELMSIVDDPKSLYLSGKYNEAAGDQIFQIGQEVKFKTIMEVVGGTRGR